MKLKIALSTFMIGILLTGIACNTLLHDAPSMKQIELYKTLPDTLDVYCNICAPLNGTSVVDVLKDVNSNYPQLGRIIQMEFLYSVPVSCVDSQCTKWHHVYKVTLNKDDRWK